MKKLVMAIFLLSPAVAVAQQGMDQEMMQQLQEMSACMATIDQNEINELEKESNKFEAEMNDLCKSGKRDEAQKKAIKFSQKVMKSPAMVTMRKCTEKMPAAMKGMVPDMSAEKIAKDFSNHHVCDEM